MKEDVNSDAFNNSSPDRCAPSENSAESSAASASAARYKAFNCFKCAKVFVNVNSLKRHGKDYHSPDHYCGVCQKERINYYYNTIGKNVKMRNFICCSYIFS